MYEISAGDVPTTHKHRDYQPGNNSIGFFGISILFRTYQDRPLNEDKLRGIV